MSLPVFSTQGESCSTALVSRDLFSVTDRYRLFGKLVYPKLTQARGALERCYCAENARMALDDTVPESRVNGLTLASVFLGGTELTLEIRYGPHRAFGGQPMCRQLGTQGDQQRIIIGPAGLQSRHLVCFNVSILHGAQRLETVSAGNEGDTPLVGTAKETQSL